MASCAGEGLGSHDCAPKILTKQVLLLQAVEVAVSAAVTEALRKLSTRRSLAGRLVADSCLVTVLQT